MDKPSYLRSSRLISILTLTSRITGLIRDSFIAGWLGAGWINDRFILAFMIPNLSRRLFGEGALSSAFIPILSENLSQRGTRRASKLFANVATLLAAVLTVLTLLILAALVVIWLFAAHDAKRSLTVGLIAVMSPYMILVCLAALFSSMLNCFDRFGLPAFAPIILNMFQIAAVFVAKFVVGQWTDRVDIQVYTLGLAVLSAGVVQLFLMIRAVNRLDIRWRFDLSVSDPDLRRILIAVTPVAVGLGVLQFGALLDSAIIILLSAAEGEGFELFGMSVHYPLLEGSLTAVNYARRLYNFPLGVLAISLATAAFPMFSRYASAGHHLQLARSVSHALRIAILQGLSCGVGMIVLAELIIRVIFERGRFSPADTAQTAFVLRMYCLGLWAYCAQHIILRAFYSLKDMITPLRVMMVTLAINVILNVTLVWIPQIGPGAFGLSTAIMCSINVIALSVIFARRFGGLDGRAIIRSAGKVMLAVAIMGSAVYACLLNLGGIDNKYLQLPICLAVGVGVFAGACYVLRIREWKDALGLSERVGID